MPEPVLLDRDQAAARLRVSLRTIRRYGQAGRLEDVRLSPHMVKVTEESVDALVREGRSRKGAAATAA